MCLLGLSLNCDSFPSIILHECDKMEEYKVGIAAYYLGNFCATFDKLDTADPSRSPLEYLYSGKTTGFSTFLFSYSRKLYFDEEKDRPPYHFAYMNRLWTMVCDLEFVPDFRKKLELSAQPICDLTGNSDEEYFFCWLMDVIHTKMKVSSLVDLTWNVFHELLESTHLFGEVKLLLCDGQDLAAYQSKNVKNPFFLLRASPPYITSVFNFDKLTVQLDSNNLNHTMLLFIDQEGHDIPDLIAMEPNQTIVARNGEAIWNSSNPSNEELSSFEEEGIVYVEEAKVPKHVSWTNPLILSQVNLIPLWREPSGEHDKSQFTASVNSYSPDTETKLYYIFHESHYQYDSPIHMSKHLLRLQPKHDLLQNVLQYKLTSTVNGKVCNFIGVFENSATLFDVTDSYTDLCFTSRSLIAIHTPPPQRYDLLHQQWTFPLIWMPWDRIMLQAYLTPMELAESELFELSDYAMSFVSRNNNCVIDVLNDINRTIYRDYTYMSGSTTLSTTPYQVYCTRRGVCQDFANLFICLARLLNIPARYRVGYIYTGTEYENKQQGDATHAWVELYLPNVGWMGFDPTNNCVQSNNHIRVACGRNFRDATPTSGTIYRGGGHERLHTAVHVIRLKPDEFYGRLKEF